MTRSIPQPPAKASPQTEIERLYRAEYGEITDLTMRLIGVLAGGVLLYVYAGWAVSFVWAPIFFAVHAVQYPFLRSRLTSTSRRDAIIGGCLFVSVHLAFIWLPTHVAAQPDPSMMLVGFMVLVATAMYHFKRADTQYWLVIVQIVIFALSLVYVAGAHMFRSDDPLVHIGVSMVTLMAVVYIALSMSAAHRKQVQLDTAQERLLQEQKMSAIGRLAGGVAHDFNNVLTVIQGNLELYHQLTDDEERQAALADAHMAARRAEGVVQQLLIYARQSPSIRRRVRVESAFQDIVAVCQTIVPAGIDFQVSVTASAVDVDLDKRQLTAAVLNLVKNAVEAMGASGTLTFTVSLQTPTSRVDRRRFDGAVPRTCVDFTVADTGQGIPRHLVDVVTDPFFTTKPVGQGTGLGLSMVSGFVDSMDGKMAIKSSARGTQVTLRFPVVEQVSQADHSDHEVLASPSVETSQRHARLDSKRSLGNLPAQNHPVN